MSRAIGLILGVAADAVFGDPRQNHPVACFGRWAIRLERRAHRDSVARGGLYFACVLAPVVAAGIAAERVSRDRPLLHTALTAAATWAVLGARSLAHEGRAMAEELDDEDLTAARERLTHLCSRDPHDLGAPELARGTVESLAENTSDAVVCSLFWGAVAGIPGLVAHRGINTLDAMVGYRNERYERFGKVSAMVDDAAAFVPARLSGVMSCLLAPAVGGSTHKAWRVMRRDAPRHPSPNAGWCEAAWAGALDVRLGGSSAYHGRIEERPVLGDPDAPSPDTSSVRQAARLVSLVTVASTVLGAVAAWRGHCDRSARAVAGKSVAMFEQG